MKFVYLDLNKWVDLARCAAGKKPSLQPVLDFLIENGKAQKICCPASLTTLIEVNKQRNKRRREELAKFVAGFSGGVFITPSYVLQDWELRNAIVQSFGIPNDRPGAKIFGHGVDFAFGSDFNEDLRAKLGSNQIENLKSPEAAYLFMAGTDESQHYLELGRKIIWEQSARYVDAVEDFRVKATDESKDVRRRAVIANELLGHRDQIVTPLAEYDLQFQDLLDLGRPALKSFFTHAPSINVWNNLNASRNEHGDRAVQQNDLQDLCSLSTAIPYCHAVVTEKFWTRLSRQHNFSSKYSTLITSNLFDLMNLSVQLAHVASSHNRKCFQGKGMSI